MAKRSTMVQPNLKCIKCGAVYPKPLLCAPEAALYCPACLAGKTQPATDKCSFCKEYAFIDEFISGPDLGDEFEQRLYSSMKLVTFKKGVRKIMANARGTVTHGVHKLNYCPECGRRLKA